jgi:hypothetical protein
MWYTGSGYEIDFNQILIQIGKHSKEKGNVFVGCDSQVIKNQCIFSTVVCLHGAQGQKGGYYFFSREKINGSEFPSMLLRLIKEVEKSIDLASKIADICPNVNIEVHIDASSKEKEKTNRFIDMLTGYAKGAGFKCRIKPDAWASNSVADKHSK